MDQARFKIVFEKLSEGSSQQTSAEPILKTVESMAVELEEIAALRRIVLEITEPEPVSYTTT
jgi:hypothetical protein